MVGLDPLKRKTPSMHYPQGNLIALDRNVDLESHTCKELSTERPCDRRGKSAPDRYGSVPQKGTNVPRNVSTTSTQKTDLQDTSNCSS